MPDLPSGSVMHEMLFVVSLYAFMRASHIVVEGQEGLAKRGMRILAVVCSFVFIFYTIAGFLTVTG